MTYPYKSMVRIIDYISGTGAYLGVMRGGASVTLPAHYFSHPRLGTGGVELMDGKTSLVNLFGAFVCIHERKMSKGIIESRWYTVEEWVTCVLNHTTVFGFCTQGRFDNKSDWGKPVIQVASVEVGEFEREVVKLDDLCKPGANMRGWYVWRRPKTDWKHWIGPAELMKNNLRTDPGVELNDPRELDLSF